jgi:hypothetical protein
VECGFNMAASNTLSTVNGHAEQHQRRRGGGGGAAAAGARPGNNSSASVLSFQCQSSGEQRQDVSVRLHSNGNCGEHNTNRQCRADFMSAKDASRRKRENRGRRSSRNKVMSNSIRIVSSTTRLGMESACRKRGQVHQGALAVKVQVQVVCVSGHL